MTKRMKVDMHVHTNHSDGIAKVETLLKKSRKIGIGLAITDHNEISGAVEAIHKKKKEDIIIPGIEVHAKEGPHFLFYFENLKDLKQFYERYVLPNKKIDPISRTRLSIKDIAQITDRMNKTKGCHFAVSIAHPTGRLWVNIERAIKAKNIDSHIYECVHAAETLSGHQPKRLNKKAIVFAQKYKLGVTAGSDAHSIVEFGKIYTSAKAANNREFIEAIKNKETFIEGKDLRYYRKALSHANIVRKHFKYAGPYFKHKIKKHGGVIRTIKHANSRFGVVPAAKFVNSKLKKIRIKKINKKK